MIVIVIVIIVIVIVIVIVVVVVIVIVIVIFLSLLIFLDIPCISWIISLYIFIHEGPIPRLALWAFGWFPFSEKNIHFCQIKLYSTFIQVIHTHDVFFSFSCNLINVISFFLLGLYYIILTLFFYQNKYLLID